MPGLEGGGRALPPPPLPCRQVYNPPATLSSHYWPRRSLLHLRRSSIYLYTHLHLRRSPFYFHPYISVLDVHHSTSKYLDSNEPHHQPPTMARQSFIGSCSTCIRSDVPCRGRQGEGKCDYCMKSSKNCEDPDEDTFRIATDAIGEWDSMTKAQRASYSGQRRYLITARLREAGKMIRGPRRRPSQTASNLMLVGQGGDDGGDYDGDYDGADDGDDGILSAQEASGGARDGPSFLQRPETPTTSISFSAPTTAFATVPFSQPASLPQAAPVPQATPFPLAIITKKDYTKREEETMPSKKKKSKKSGKATRKGATRAAAAGSSSPANPPAEAAARPATGDASGSSMNAIDQDAVQQPQDGSPHNQVAAGDTVTTGDASNTQALDDNLVRNPLISRTMAVPLSIL